MKKTDGKKVRFQCKAAPKSEVYVAGTFNDWDFKKHPMKGSATNGSYKLELTLPPGRHEYKFVVNGEWCLDPNGATAVPNGHGSLNSVVIV